MKNLKFAFFVYALYVHKDNFIGYFNTFENAEAFVKQYYKGVQAHIRPIEIWSVARS